jgi:large repetitive protein
VLKFIRLSCFLLLASSTSVSMTSCGSSSNTTPDATIVPPPQCSNGIDDDGDGKSDFPDDLSCLNAQDDSETGPASPECSDNRDNDGDGKMDYPSDPGCSAPNQEGETDDCPTGPNCPQCANGKDDDGNGKMDFPDDQGCNAASDVEEFNRATSACGAGVLILPLPPAFEAIGSIAAGSPSTLSTNTCAGTGGEKVYKLTIAENRSVTATTVDPMTTLDTVISIRSSMCAMSSSEVACNDDVSAAVASSTVTAVLPAGEYYIIVDAHDASSEGNFKLKVTTLGGEGTTCTTSAECGGGLVCRVPDGQATKVCTQPVCNDGIDGDGDGKIDYPRDPGCVSPSDDTEEDTCNTSPPGPTCPACGNGVDDDVDGTIDYPLDSDCASASQTSERACPDETDPLVRITNGVGAAGVTATTSNSIAPSCGFADGKDRAFSFTLPAMKSLTIDSTGSATSFSTNIVLRNASCAAPDLGCSEDTTLTVNNLNPGLYVAVLDTGNNGTSNGIFRVAIRGEIVGGSSCEGTLAAAGAIVCEEGYSCTGAAGAKICTPASCNDTIDNDGDGKIDFPNEPGCTSKSDNSEQDTCPGAGCPVCSDGLDNDGDSFTDYPNDTTCKSASGDDELCNSTEDVIVVTTGTISGTTVGQTNDYQPSCGSSSDSGPDRLYQLDLPALDSFKVAFSGNYDSVVALLPASCGSPSVECEDFSPIEKTTPLAAGRYFLVNDGYSTTAAGTFTNTITGIISSGGSCESALATSGALTCAAGTTCKGTVGSRTCAPAACGDNIDADGDGKPGFPTDPGCSSTTDDDETDTCPGGATCPKCSNGIDDDRDGRIDYPTEGSCISAAGNAETTCALETDPIVVVNAPSLTGTTVGKANNLTPTCGSSGTAREVTYSLTLPVQVLQLTIDTEGSTLDTIVSLRNEGCGSPDLQCDDDTGASGGSSLITAIELPPSTYMITVDGYSGSPAAGEAFKLQVKGEVIAGTACTDRLFTQGVLTCTSGTACVSGICQ